MGVTGREIGAEAVWAQLSLEIGLEGRNRLA